MKLYIVMFVLTGSISLFFSYDISSTLIGYFMLITSLMIFYIFSLFIEHDRKYLTIICFTYVITGLILFVSLLLTGQLLGAGRISTADSVRKIVNVAVPGVVLLFNQILIKTSNKNYSIFGNKIGIFSSILLMLPIVLLIFSTVSRGGLLALGVTISLTLIFYLYINLRRRVNLKLFLIIVSLSFMLSLVYTYVEVFVSGNYFRRLNINNFYSNIRLDIWRSAIYNMNGIEYLIGVGPNSFRKVAIESGFDHYAHSVFVDSFVSFGVVGFCILVSLLILLFVRSVKMKNVFTFSIILLSVSLYVTHGNLTGSMDFWALLGITNGTLNNEIRSKYRRFNTK